MTHHLQSSLHIGGGSRGLSSVESMIGTAICLLLVALLTQGMSDVEERRVEVLCQANLRQLAASVQRYAVDNNGRMPDALDRSTRPWRWWTNEVFPYVEDVRAFYCPVVAPQYYGSRADSPLLPVTWDPGLLSYGMNYRFGTAHGRDKNLRIDQLTHPENTILLAESHYYLVRIHSSVWLKDIAPRHKGRANVVFVNGAVDSFEIDGDQYPRRQGEGIYNTQLWEL